MPIRGLAMPRNLAYRHPEAGFTLIETLVALAVLATAAVALIGATQAHVNRIAGLEERAAAQWAGENALAETALGVDVAQQPVTMMAYEFQLAAERSPTLDSAVGKVSVRVMEPQGAIIANVTGFVLIKRAEGAGLP